MNNGGGGGAKRSGSGPGFGGGNRNLLEGAPEAFRPKKKSLKEIGPQSGEIQRNARYLTDTGRNREKKRKSGSIHPESP